MSLLTDAASEMVLPLLPVFLTGVLGAGPAALGWIEGAADAVASLLKLASGRWADRTGRTRPFVLAGYGLSSAVRPLVALATGPLHVLAVRVTDRVGKGLRSSPRDALLAASVADEARGTAFGFHRAMDHAGAVVGPLLALAVLAAWPGDLRRVFALAAIPGALVILVLLTGVREPEGPVRREPVRLWPPPAGIGRFLLPLALVSLGRGSELYLLLAVGGRREAWTALPLLWMGLHGVKVGASLVGGRLADRSPRATVAAGWAVHVLVFAAFALVRDPRAAIVLFLLYGISPGLSEAAEKTLVAAVVPAGTRGTAFGWYHLTGGILALPAGALFGTVWQVWGPGAALGLGATLGVLGLAGLAALRR